MFYRFLKQIKRTKNRKKKEKLYQGFPKLKFVSATFLLVCFVCLKERTCETRKNVLYFISKALFVLEIIKF